MRINELAPTLYNAVLQLEKQVQASSLDAALIHLIKLRASQLNHCAFCVNMHTEEALAGGIDPRKIYLLTVWEESPLFDARERAALAWTESVTLVAETGVPDDAFALVRSEFSETEVAELTVAIATINVWNRIAVSSRTPHR
ncbi:MAG: carboxymuconolactone decarboxylase family protein [Thermomicrobiales bacterium]|nr:carboxymuconolactone decarboxylase family protein [Thermomicrobiales bacterium]MCO5222041.1 carboxymuconolactone decarboxylase family protein [Thermomicrobiales bacterium]